MSEPGDSTTPPPGAAPPGASTPPGESGWPEVSHSSGESSERQPAEEPPLSGQEQFGLPPPGGWQWRPAPPERRGPVAVAAVAVAIGAAVLGAPFGLLWAAVAPEVPVRITQRGPAYGTAQPEQLAGADTWFALLAVPFGILLAVAAWLLARRARGLPALVAVTVGAVAAALVGWWLGRHLGLADYESTLAAAEPGTQLERPPDLRVAEAGWWPPQVLGVLLVPAVAAAATYTMLAAWSRFPSLRPDPPPAYPPPPPAYPPPPPAYPPPPPSDQQSGP